VRKLVDQQHFGPPGQRGVKVEFLQRAAAVGNVAPRHLLQPRQQRGGVGAAMRLDHADHHVAARLALALRGAEHGPGLADARIGAEIDAQLAAPGTGLLLAHQRKQFVGVRAGGFLHRPRGG